MASSLPPSWPTTICPQHNSQCYPLKTSARWCHISTQDSPPHLIQGKCQNPNSSLQGYSKTASISLSDLVSFPLSCVSSHTAILVFLTYRSHSFLPPSEHWLFPLLGNPFPWNPHSLFPHNLQSLLICCLLSALPDHLLITDLSMIAMPLPLLYFSPWVLWKPAIVCRLSCLFYILFVSFKRILNSTLAGDL